MDLAEFLLARVDEIDPLRGRLSDDLPHHPYCAGMAVDDYGEQYEFRPDLCDCGVPQRILAECAAKRAIIEFFAEKLARPAEVPNWIIPRIEARQILVTLAQPFADHPDFRPEWGVVKA